MTSLDIELALAQYFGVLPRHGGMGSNRNMIIPNFKAIGLNHEADLFLITPSGCAWEIEIKVSRSDLARDAKKMNHHRHEIISRLWFAMPDTMRDCVDLVPEHAGIMFINSDGSIWEYRPSKIITGSRKLTDTEILHCGRIAAMRIWTLKKKLRGNDDTH